MQSPELSIIMLSFNSESFIREAIRSILNQTFRDFELIVIDNGSSDHTISIIESFNDTRINLYRNDPNTGIAISRNQGLSIAKGQFLACFDSDDIAHPNKFEKQLDFLRKNDEFGFAGTAVKLIDSRGKVIARWKLRAKPEIVPFIMLFHNYFVNSAVVFKRSVLGELRYREDLEIGEDYYLWWQLLQKSKALNLPEYLTLYRQHKTSQMALKNAGRPEHDKRVYELIFRKPEFDINSEDMEVHLKLKDQGRIKTFREIKAHKHWLLKIWNHYSVEKNKVRYLKKTIYNRWMKVGYKSRRKVLIMLRVIFDFSFYYKLFVKQKA